MGYKELDITEVTWHTHMEISQNEGELEPRVKSMDTSGQ